MTSNNEHNTIRILDSKKESVNKFSNSKKVIGLEFEILDKPVCLKLIADDKKAKLSDIIPAARKISQIVVDVVLAELKTRGISIPCKKGCSACCARCIIPLSVPEALQLSSDISNLPQWQREQVEASLIRASGRILKNRPPEWLKEQAGGDKNIYLNRLSSWYANINTPCSFLYKGECTVYSIRPLACREHFVQGSTRKCSGGRGMASVVELPVRMVDVLAELAAELENSSVESVMMPLVLAWYESNSHRDERRWPAVEIAQKFAAIVKRAAREKAMAAEVPA